MEQHTGTTRRVEISADQLSFPKNGKSATRSTSKYSFMRPLLTCAVLTVAAFALSACAFQPTTSQTSDSIEVESLRLTAAGHYIDLRYRVLDAEKASKVIGPGVKPVLIDEATGMVMAVPMTAKLGSLRQTRGVQKPDHLYFILFVNGAGLNSGSLVTAEIGDMRFENLTVE
jgi:hypothetical protein